MTHSGIKRLFRKLHHGYHVKKMPPLETLWFSNAAFVVLSVINTLAWGYAIKEVGAFSFTPQFLWRLGTNPYFIAALLTALVGVVATYVGRSSIGLGKASLFYGVGTISIVLTSHLVFGEKFDNYQILGAALVMGGSVLLLQ